MGWDNNQGPIQKHHRQGRERFHIVVHARLSPVMNAGLPRITCLLSYTYMGIRRVRPKLCQKGPAVRPPNLSTKSEDIQSSYRSVRRGLMSGLRCNHTRRRGTLGFNTILLVAKRSVSTWRGLVWYSFPFSPGPGHPSILTT